MALQSLNIVVGLQIRESSDLTKILKIVPSSAQTTGTTRIVNGPETGDVSLEYMVGVSSNIQTQLGATATKALDNLASVAINTSLLPATAGAIAVGSATKTFGEAHTRNLIIYSTSDVALARFDNNGNLPSGSVVNVHIRAVQQGHSLGISTPDSASTSGDIIFETGDATDNTGSFVFTVGTAGSDRGSFQINASKVFRGPSFLDYVTEEWIPSISLLASQTDTLISEFTFDASSFEMATIDYKLKEATTNNVRAGRLTIVTNGTDASVMDASTETAPLGVSFSVAIAAGPVLQVKYTNDTNAITMQADFKLYHV